MAQIDKSKKENFKSGSTNIIQPSAGSAIGKYFSIDISNLDKYLKDAQSIGKEYKEAIVEVNNDMDLFITADIRHYKDGRLTVEFWGDRAELTPKLVRFINEYVKLNGPCLDGAGEITKDDYKSVEHGDFARMWENACVNISNNSENKRVMVLGLYNPPQATTKPSNSVKEAKIKKS